MEVAVHKLWSRFSSPVKWRLGSAMDRFSWRRVGLHRVLSTGLRIQVEDWSEWIIFNEIFVDGDYDEPIRLAIERAGRGAVMNVWDLGANVGFFALRFAHLAHRCGAGSPEYRLTLVEGSPTVARRLESRIGLDPELKRRVRVFQGLVGRPHGTGTIYEQPYAAMNSVRAAQGWGDRRVSYLDLRSILDGTRHIDLLKCDIEGSEGEFIESYGDLLGIVRHAVFEFHHEHVDAARARRLLADAGLEHHRVLMSTPVVSVEMFWRE